MRYDEIWYHPVMPTPEEQRMMDAARKRIASQRYPASVPSPPPHFSLRGFLMAIALLGGIGLVLIATFFLFVVSKD